MPYTSHHRPRRRPNLRSYHLTRGYPPFKKPAPPLLAVAARAGHADTRMTLDRYGHLIRAGSDRAAAEATDRIMADLMSPKIEPLKNPRLKLPSTVREKKKAHKPLRRKQKSMVEMRGLEPLTPYMRSKCSTS
jgi:hypothetical protein